MAENKSNQKLEEANFEVSSLAEVKDENGNGIFHLRTKTKFILVISILILLSAGALIYLALENYFASEIWQLAVWGLCGVLAIYSIAARSVPTMLLNLVLFFGVSLIPVWQAGHETFKPVIDKFISEPAAPVEAPEQVPEKIPEQKTEVEITEPEKISPPAEVERPAEKVPELENKSAEPSKPVETQKNKSPALDLPSI